MLSRRSFLGALLTAVAAPAEASKSWRTWLMETCTVACKIPNGMLLRVFDFEEVSVPHPGGGRSTERKAKQVGEPVHVNGPAMPVNAAPGSKEIYGGAALTHGVPVDFWLKYKAQNPDSDAINRGLLFAFVKAEDARDAAKGLKDERSGLEPLDMRMVQRGDDKVPVDTRIPRGARGTSLIEPDDGK